MPGMKRLQQLVKSDRSAKWSPAPTTKLPNAACRQNQAGIDSEQATPSCGRTVGLPSIRNPQMEIRSTMFRVTCRFRRS